MRHSRFPAFSGVFARLLPAVLVTVLATTALLAAPPAVEKIIYTGNGADMRLQLFAINSDGTGRYQFTDAPGRGADQAAVSPDGRYVAYTVVDNAQSCVYLLDLNDGKTRRVSDGVASDYAPTFSRDSRKVIVRSTQGQAGTLFALSVEGAGRDLVGVHGKDAGRLATAGDGTTLVDLYPGIALLNAQGQVRQTVKALGQRVTASPTDTALVAYDTFADDGWNIWVMKTDGSNARAVTKGIDCYYGPTFSPDGTRIAFAGYTTGNRAEKNMICTVGVDGTDLCELVSNLPRRPLNPVWARLVAAPPRVDPTPEFSPFWQQLLAPPAPKLTMPADAADVDGARIDLTWTTAPDATAYEVQVGRDPLFRTLVLACQDMAVTTVDAPDLVKGTTYWWHARATNAKGASAWSATWSFRVKPDPVAGQPDMLVRAQKNGPYIGLNYYGDAEAQCLQQDTQKGKPAVFYLAVRNTGLAEDTFILKATGGNADWIIAFADAKGTAVTTAMTGDGWRVTLGPGAVAEFTCAATPGATAGSFQAFDVVVTGVSSTNARLTDAAMVTTRRIPGGKKL
jgi:hypothetical protein